MALRLANKFHGIVNNVVLQAGKVRRFSDGPSRVPRTRYPLNQMEANAYIEQLNHSTRLPSDHLPARTLTVNVCKRVNTLETHQKDMDSAAGSSLLTTLRHFSSKPSPPEENAAAAKKDPGASCTGKRGVVKMPKRKQVKECKRMKKNEDETCKRFKIVKCEQPTFFDCTRRKYVFKNCRKNEAPYPSFSEACYEPPYPMIHECKDCPWDMDHHPTFKQPKVMLPVELARWRKAQAALETKGKRGFHTTARRSATLRFGDDSEEDERARHEREVQEKPHAIRPHNWNRRHRMAALANAPPCEDCPWMQMPKFDYKPLPLEQQTEPMLFVTELMDRKKTLDAELRHMEAYEEAIAKVQGLRIEAKNRVKITGDPICPTWDCNNRFVPKSCPKKIKSKVCPEDLLDRTRYKKYQKGGTKKSKKGGQKNRKDGGMGAKSISPEAVSALVVNSQMKKNVTLGNMK